jgi:hypothetical protein
MKQTRNTNPKTKAGIMKHFKVGGCVRVSLYRPVRVSTETLKFDSWPPVRRASERGVPSPVPVHVRCRPDRLSVYHPHSSACVASPLRAPSRQGKRTERPRHGRRAYSGRSTCQTSADFPCPRRRIRTHQHACSCEYEFHAEIKELNSPVVDPPDQRARGRRDLRSPLKAGPRTPSYQ